ncbi:MAG: DUF4943 family protein [Bacteroidales bacterium]|nr:DUF4943 family protein [Bacteroidales bacterium]MBN2748725.1 DUF4943 family protein [Bacteroidales bacterium]
MKKVMLVWLCVVMLGLGGCSDDRDNKKGLTVERYVELLKQNRYDSLDLPDFSYSDIPELLKYRDDQHVITTFPRNPISSSILIECKLGVYILWTIESIRARSINSEALVMRFPSQNAVLWYRNSYEVVPESDILVHKAVSDAYYSWWYTNTESLFDDFKSVDPLADTEYRW